MQSVLTKKQRLKFGPKVYTEGGETYRITANVRHDDECGNGHNTFSITGDIYRKARDGRWIYESGGCIHEDVARHFPALAPLIKWHLCSTDGPMHYLANTLYLAGDRDCHGLRKGETRQIRNGKTGQPAWKQVAIGPDGTETEINKLPRYADGEKPADVYTIKWAPWNRVGEGKAPDPDSARRAAIWPDATLEQLQDKATLEARLPALLAEFRAAVESLGLVF